VNIVKLYLLTALVFFALDFVWLSRVAQGFYQNYLGHLLRPEPLILAAVVFYALYIAGIIVFAVLPGIEAGDLSKTVMLGAFLGLFAYATFDLTCRALFIDFPIVVVVVDLIWGSVLTAAVSAAGFGIGRWLGMS